MKRNGRIVIAGYYGFGNVGDELILKSLLALLKRRGADGEVVVLSHAPRDTESSHGVSAVDRWSPFGVLSALSGCDLLVFGGGGLLQDSTGLLSLAYYLSILWTAILFRKKIWVYAVGIGPIQSSLGRLCATGALNRVEVVTVRDPASKTALESWGIKKPAQIIHDPVLDLEFPAAGERPPGAQPRFAFILRALKDPGREEELRGVLASVIESLAEETGAGIFILSLHPAADQAAVSALLELCARKGVRKAGVSAFEWRKAEELASFLSGMDAVVTLRLHGAILSAVLGVPSLGIAVDPKIAAFQEGFPLPPAVKNVLKCEECRKELLRCVRAGWKHKPELAVLNARKIAQIRARGGEADPEKILARLLLPRA